MLDLNSLIPADSSCICSVPVPSTPAERSSTGHRGTGGLSIRPWRHHGDRHPSPNDLGRALANVDGVLNGANTAFITGFGQPPAPFIVLNATSFEVFLTNGG